MTFLVFGRPDIREVDIEAVTGVLRSGWIGTGPVTERFEEVFREYTGAGYAVAVSSCTAALHLSLLALGVGRGDEVIVPSLTFASTANAVVHTGARPVLADVDSATMCLTAEEVERRLTSRTRAVMPVHFAGRPCDIEAIVSLGVPVVEDCAHAIETTIAGKHVGTFGMFGAFSFYATKNITTGEGGMIVTQDPDAAERLERLALHGLSNDAWRRFTDTTPKHYEVVEAGFKNNMTDLQAALGLSQLARIEQNLMRREAIWAAYDEAFADLQLVTPPPAAPGTRHARHLYTVMAPDRDKLMSDLHGLGIGTGVHYRALHLHPFYRGLGYRPGDFPGAEWVSTRTLSLPLSAGMTDSDVARVVSGVRQCMQA